MIGQTKLLEQLNRYTIDNLPHYIIFVGRKGSGRTTVSKYLANKFNASFAYCGIKVDDIREIIDTAYKVRDLIVYCIQDADTIRNEAKNAMLKITEEPPENAYFIMTVQDDSSLLDTIKSRAAVFYMQPYTPIELREYYNLNYTKADSDIDTLVNIASTPYEIDKLIEYGGDFIEYVELVVDNISEVEPANAFKSSNKLALKKEEGYDLQIFFNTFINICTDRILTNPLHYAAGITTTTPFLLKSMKLGANKQQLYDNWVFKIREVWV